MLEVQTEGLDFTLRRIDAKVERMREALVGTHFAERDFLEARIAELEERRENLVTLFQAHHYAELVELATLTHAIPLRHLPRFVRWGRSEADSIKRNDSI